MPNEKKLAKTSPEFLNSWKEIANYMGRGVRTVQRYEVEYGLPIRRPANKSRSAVMATRAEIDAWVAAAPFRERYELSKINVSKRLPSVAVMLDGVAKMHELRGQMLELRAETHAALNVFMSSLDGLHRELNAAQGSGSNGVIAHPPMRMKLGANSSLSAGKLAKDVA